VLQDARQLVDHSHAGGRRHGLPTGRGVLQSTALQMLGAPWRSRCSRRPVVAPVAWVAYGLIAVEMIVGYTAVVPGFVLRAAWWPRWLTRTVAVLMLAVMTVTMYVWFDLVTP